MGNSTPKNNKGQKSPAELHKRTITESELYNFRDNVDYEKSTQNNLQEFINNQNELNSLLRSYLLESLDNHHTRLKAKRQDYLQTREKQKDMLVDLPIRKDKEQKWDFQALKSWIEDVGYTVCEEAARQHSRGQMHSDQLSKYCLQNILDNMSNLHQHTQLSCFQLEQLQNHLINTILPSIAHKYQNLPMREITKMLSKTDFTQHCQLFVIQINNSDQQNQQKLQQSLTYMLDHRDRSCEQPFDFRVEISLREIERPDFIFIRSKSYELILKHIKGYLVESVANILSVSFRSLNQGNLLQDEAKNYVAMNILQNTRSILTKTLQAIDKCRQLTRKTDNLQLKNSLIMQFQLILNNILINLGDYYTYHPQTNFAKRMKNISEMDRSQDQSNDLLTSNNIKMERYYVSPKERKERESGRIKTKTEDYSEFIMLVVNTAIRATRSYQEDSRERTVSEIFAEFNQQLFTLSQNQNFKSLIQLATDESRSAEEIALSKKAISNYFKRITQTNSQRVKQMEKIIKCNLIDNSKDMDQKLQKKNTILDYSQSLSEGRMHCEVDNILQGHMHSPSTKIEIQRNCSKINQQRQKETELFRNSKIYTFQQEIPIHVRTFTQQEINSKKFTAKDPAILKVLTQWASNLQRIFVDAQRYVMLRVYPFKDMKNQPVYLSLRQKGELLHNIKRQQKEVSEMLQMLKSKNNQLVGYILSKETDCFASSVFRFSETRQASSKINSILASIMVEYLSILITHLLKAGRLQSAQSKQNCHLNLIIFGVSHLLKAQLNCDQSTLSTIIKAMHILDDCQSLQKRFRLIRIRDKINQSNIVQVNYMFMDRLQCQIQLAIQQPKGREKHYLTFGNFIRQLTINQLGVISNCAQAVAQYDPLTACSKQTPYKQKIAPKYQQVSQQEMSQNQLGTQSRSQWSSCILTPQSYQCQQCGNMILNQSNSLFQQLNNLSLCLNCNLASEDYLYRLKNAKLKKILHQNTKQAKIQRINNYSQLKITNQNFIPILTVDCNGKLEFKIVVFIRSELSHFAITVTHQTIKDIIQNSINYQHIEYNNITQSIASKQKITDCLVFQIRKVEDLSKEALQLMGFHYKEQVQHIFQNATSLAQHFESYRKEKNLVKSIKFKAEIINCDHDQQKWDIFTKLLTVYSRGKLKKDHAKLKYHKYKSLQFDRIKMIQANNCHIHQIPQEINLCSNLREFISKDSKIKDGLNLKLRKLRHLNLQNNMIEKTRPSADLKELQYLDLTYNQLQTTDSLATLSSLRELNLSCNQLHRVDGLSSLSNLSRLLLKENQLHNISGLANLTNLSYLELSANKLTNVDSLSNLTNLTHLYLGWNELKNVNGLSQLINLKVLDLNLNELQNLDGLSSLINLKQLYLSSNSLKNLQSISSLVNLNKLVLSFNQLQNIDFLSKNINLEYLSVNDNKLKHSVSFKKLYKLKEISLQDNIQLKVTDLPASLQKLYVDLTAVEGVDFKNMISLRKISIKGQLKDTKLKNLPQTVQIKEIQ